MTAARALSEYDDDWDDLPMDAQNQLLGSLRLFLEHCPSCHGTLEFGTERVESCCREIEVVAVSCPDCGARILEVNHEGI